MIGATELARAGQLLREAATVVAECDRLVPEQTVTDPTRPTGISRPSAHHAQHRCGPAPRSAGDPELAAFVRARLSGQWLRLALPGRLPIPFLKLAALARAPSMCAGEAKGPLHDALRRILTRWKRTAVNARSRVCLQPWVVKGRRSLRPNLHQSRQGPPQWDPPPPCGLRSATLGGIRFAPQYARITARRVRQFRQLFGKERACG